MPQKHTIAFGADHAGFEMKQDLIEYAKSFGYEAIDFGTDSTEPYDYPLVVPMVVESIRSTIATRGVLICGSGIGIDMAANRFRGMRSALCHSPKLAETARIHNNANILSLGARFMDLETARQCLKVFLETEFSPDERHHRRVGMLDSFM